MGEGFFKTFLRSNQEKNKDKKSDTVRPSLQELYRLYGYTPPGIQGATLDHTVPVFEFNAEEMNQVNQAITIAMDALPYRFHTKVKVSGGVFEVSVSEADDTKHLQPAILLRLRGDDQSSIADFNFMRNKAEEMAWGNEQWILYHRFVSDNYRGQDIGSKMLKILEHGIQYTADKTKRSQAVEIQARQLGVINFAFKNGYKPVAKKDLDKLDMIYGGDKSKILIATGKGHFTEKDGGGDVKPGFIYSVSALQEKFAKNWHQQLSPEQIWTADLDRIFYGEPREYIDQALTVRFKKEINPQVEQSP